MLDFELPLWIDEMGKRFDYDLTQQLEGIGLDAISAILREADAVDVHGEEYYANPPMKVAVILEGLMRQLVLPYDNLGAAQHTADVAFGLAGLRLELDQRARRTYKNLLTRLEEGQACRDELGFFLAAHVRRDPRIAEISPAPAPVQVQLLIASHQWPGDEQELDDWILALRDGLQRGGARPDVPLQVETCSGTQPPDGEHPAERPAATVVLVQNADSGDAFFQLGALGPRHITLLLAPRDAAIPDAVEDACACSNLRIRRFESAEEITSLAEAWTRRNAKRLLMAQREAVERSNVSNPAQIELRRRWMALDPNSQLELANRCRLPIPLALGIMLDGNVYFDRLGEAAVLAAALGTTLAEISISQKPLALSAEQERWLDNYVIEYPETTAAEVLELRKRGVEEIKRFVCRWSLTSVQDWRALFTSGWRRGR